MSETSTGTGRLFRSLRAEGAAADVAVPALTLDQAVGLRTVTLGGGGDAPPPLPPTAVAPAVAAPVVAAPVVSAPAVEDLNLEYAEVAPRPDVAESSVAPATADVAGASLATGASTPSGRGAHAAPGVRATGVWLVVIGVTVVMGFADALVVGRTQLGWLTGISLLAASVYGALVVRREDAIIAVIAPPLAFFVATITAGQLTLPPTGDLLVREAFMIITTLGANAAWIFGSTIVALVIVLVRRRRSVPATPSPQP
ncbi:MAG: DUF6542 domain-containing protein [Candidatus Nanopelagicales bacterium]